MPTSCPLLSCGFLIAVALAPLPATADINGLLRGVIRDVSTQAVTNGTANSQTKTTKTANSSRQTNKRIQQALNSNGYDAGVADGILGARSRRAIKSYQTANGFNPTGKLTSGQKNRLLGSGAESVLAPVIPALIGGVTDGTLTRKRNTPAKSATVQRQPTGTPTRAIHRQHRDGDRCQKTCGGQRHACCNQSDSNPPRNDQSHQHHAPKKIHDPKHRHFQHRRVSTRNAKTKRSRQCTPGTSCQYTSANPTVCRASPGAGKGLHAHPNRPNV